MSPKKDDEVSRLEAEIRNLKSQVRSLQKRLKKVDRKYRPSNENEESFEQKEPKKEDPTQCKNCDGGTLITTSLGIKTLTICNTCGTKELKSVKS